MRKTKTKKAAKANGAVEARIKVLQNGLRALRSRLSALERYATSARDNRERAETAEAKIDAALAIATEEERPGVEGAVE